jgi:hypothetical protein
MIIFLGYDNLDKHEMLKKVEKIAINSHRNENIVQQYECVIIVIC